MNPSGSDVAFFVFAFARCKRTLTDRFYELGLNMSARGQGSYTEEGGDIAFAFTLAQCELANRHDWKYYPSPLHLREVKKRYRLTFALAQCKQTLTVSILWMPRQRQYDAIMTSRESQHDAKTTTPTMTSSGRF